MEPLLRSLACSTAVFFLADSLLLARRGDRVDVSLQAAGNRGAISTSRFALSSLFVAYVSRLTAKPINSAGLCNDQFELSITWLCFRLGLNSHERKVADGAAN